MRAWLFALLALMVALPAHAEERSYEVGQVWAYEVDNAGDDGALIIQRIDRAEETGWPTDIYHISMVVEVQLGEMDQLEIGHLPVSRETLDSAVTQPSERDMIVFADWNEGYKEWQRAEGGVFTVGLSEVIDVLLEIMAPRTAHSAQQ